MLIIHMQGGLGNQLYQYAFFEKLRSLGKDVRLDSRDYFPGAKFPEKRPLVLDQFPLVQPVYSSPVERASVRDDSVAFSNRLRRKLFGSRDRIYFESGDYDREVFRQDNAYLEGFWCNEAYFHDIMPLVRERLTFPELQWCLEGDTDNISRIEKNSVCIRSMEEEYSIGIHIRLGDYTDDEHRWRYENICTPEYYRKAFECVLSSSGSKRDGRRIFIFTDETDRVRSRMSEEDDYLGFLRGEDVVICDWNGDRYSIFDLMLMSRCRAMICANSTFSMWGARLSPRQEHMMIRPLRHDNASEPDIQHMKRTWKDWIMIDRDGNLV